MTSTRPRELPSVGFDPEPEPPSHQLVGLMLVGATLILAGLVFGRADRLAENSGDFPDTVSPATTAPLSLATWTEALTTIDRPMSETLIATESGFAVLSGIGDDAWLSDDGRAWTRRELDSAARGFLSDGDDLGVFRDTTVWWLDSERRAGATSELPALVRRGQMSERPGVILFDGRLLVESPDGELYAESADGTFEVVVPAGTWSADPLDPWEAATAPRRPNSCRPPRSGSIDQVPFVEFDSALLALVAGGDGRPHGIWPLCAPNVWRSFDGVAWDQLTAESPFASSTYIYDVAAHDGQLVAVGGAGADRPALWGSIDGVDWARRPIMGIPGFARYEPTQIDAGPAGWVIIGTAGADTAGWVSADGRCWEPMPPDLQPRGAVSGEHVIVVIDAAGTVWSVQAGQTC